MEITIICILGGALIGVFLPGERIYVTIKNALDIQSPSHVIDRVDELDVGGCGCSTDIQSQSHVIDRVDELDVGGCGCSTDYGTCQIGEED